MEIEAGSANPNADGDDDYKGKMSRGLKRTLVVFNCLITILGTVGGPLISRLYFHHGGKRIWLSSFLETAGFPIIALPLPLLPPPRRADPGAKPVLMTLPVFAACVAIGVLTGVDDYLYAYGLSFLPVSTSALLVSTQLAFTALFAWVVVKQRFTPFSLNSVALLTVGAVILGRTRVRQAGGRDAAAVRAGLRPDAGLRGAVGLVLPLVELTYAKAKQKITYTLVMEMQLVMGCFATLFCLVGMIVNNDFKVIPRRLRVSG
ncbi:purine permease 1-like isoform X1 [Iris pallida]|uniref:Purine permease 1-like isoform X1 n=1 Tax=Iris pallida TaxID=29817 RepID=A0AAX6HT48_IRIPA|nr:purine permease 1-like isoform X1 [Iris pallida]